MNKEKSKFIDGVDFNALKLTVSDQQMQINELRETVNRLSTGFDRLCDTMSNYTTKSQEVFKEIIETLKACQFQEFEEKTQEFKDQLIERNNEFVEMKSVIKKNFENGRCGIFFVENIVGDSVETVFKGKFFKVNLCSGYCYFDVLGCSEDEQELLKIYYENLNKQYNEAWEEECKE